MKHWILNTSNQGKKEEFERLFAAHGLSLEFQQHDLPEIDADPVTVVVHKASQLGENILVDDTSLDVEGVVVGVHVRWVLEKLSQYAGKKAVCRVLLAYQKSGHIYVFEGKVHGTIVQPRGVSGFGFDPVFLPDNSTKTLAESKPDELNPRAKVVSALVRGDSLSIAPLIPHWDGAWQ